MSDIEADFAVLLRSGMWEMRGSLSSNRYRYNAICQYGMSETTSYSVQVEDACGFFHRLLRPDIVSAIFLEFSPEM